MATSEARASEQGESRSITDVLRILGMVVWAFFALFVGIILATLVWALLDIGPVGGKMEPMAFLTLVALSVLGTVALAVLAVLDV